MKKTVFYSKIVIVFTVVSFTLFLACDQLTGGLDETPKSFATPESFYTTPAQVEAAFVTSLHSIDRAWGGYGWAMRPFFHIKDNHHGGFNITPNWGSALWTDHYRAIAQLNFAIKSMNEGALEGVPQSRLNELMAQGRFLRAHNYFMLVRMWGALPLLTDETENYYTYLPSRTPIEGVYDLIVSDFTFAKNHLPDAWPSEQAGRPTSGVTAGLLAKAYLTMATAPMNDQSYYQQAAQNAREVIESNRYSLVEDVDNVFSFETEFGPEMMWSYIATPQHQNTSPQTWTHQEGWGDHSVDQVWLDRYPEQPRRYAYIEHYNYDGVHHQETGHRAGLAKYRYTSVEDMQAGRNFSNKSVIRYADVLLLFAEAENRVNGGPTQEAVDAVNQIIDRANGYEINPEHPRVHTGMSMQEFETAVIRERELELCFEYDRWFDLIRHRLLPDALREEYRVNFSEHNYLWPLPDQDLRQNENLEQNPGYPHPL